MIAEGEAIPQAQEVDVHVNNPDFAGGVWAVIDFDITPYLGKSVRFNATLPEHLLNRIDERVQKDHRYASRSGFLATAAVRELGVVYAAGEVGGGVSLGRGSGHAKEVRNPPLRRV